MIFEDRYFYFCYGRPKRLLSEKSDKFIQFCFHLFPLFDMRVIDEIYIFFFGLSTLLFLPYRKSQQSPFSARVLVRVSSSPIISART